MRGTRRIAAMLGGVLFAAMAVTGCEPGPPALTVEGAPLVDGGRAMVHGTGFVAGEELSLVQCAAQPIGIVDCDHDTSTKVTVAPDGSFDATVPVYSLLRGWGRRPDCRVEGSCVLAARVGFDGTAPIVVPLVFDPAAPLLPGPTLTADTPTGLTDGQRVRFTGRNFLRASGTQLRGSAGPVEIFHCMPQDVLYCGRLPLAEVPVGADGSFAVDLPVSATFDTEWGSEDCRTRDEPCYLLATRGTSIGEGAAEVARFDLHLDPDAPLQPAPSPELSAGLGDFESVTVEGRGFDATSAVDVEVCRADDPSICDMRHGETVTAGLDGSLTTEIAVSPTWIRPGWGDATDCRVAPGCVIAATPHGSETLATVPLTFAPAGPSRGRYLDPVFAEVEVVSDVVYRDTVDNRGNPIQLRMDIFRPRGDTVTNRPAIMWMHGGFFLAGDKALMHDDARAAAQRGYVGVSIQYRLFRGGTETWRDSYRGSLDAYDDATAAVQWLQAHAAEYGINPEAIVAGGFSAGAVTALNLAYLPGQRGPTSPLVAAAVSRGGILYTPPAVGDPPTIAFHGSVDEVTKFANLGDVCDLASAVDIACELVIYDGAGHTEGDLDDVMRRTTDFLAAHVLPGLGYDVGDGGGR